VINVGNGKNGGGMKKTAFFLCIILIFNIFIIPSARADELSDLKTEISALKEQVKAQMDLIREQNRQMNTMQKRVEELETRGQVSEQKGDVKVSWKDGFVYSMDDPAVQLKVGGRLQMDTAYFSEESKVKAKVGKVSDGAEFRRARFYMKGTAIEDIYYKLEYDFATGTPQLKDGFIGVKNIPYLGSIQAGHMFEPFGMENQVSTNYLPFAEHALPTTAFSHVRNVGIKIHNAVLDDRMTWATGVFRDADDFGLTTERNYNWSTRVTALPWYEDEGRKYAHLGFSYSLRFPQDTISYSTRPEAHLAPTLVDTGDIRAQNANMFGYEAAMVYGPMYLQSECITVFVNQKDEARTAFLYGIYGQAGYFLTGEHRPYKRSSGLYGRLRPKRNFSVKNFLEGDIGAWEVLARYSYLDLNDKGHNISGGILGDVSLGLTWYLTPNVRWMGNYIHSDLFTYGATEIFLTRLQIDF